MRYATALLLSLAFAAPLAAQPCNPSQTDEVCPDTTDWHRYFPLDIGNRWQYVRELEMGEDSYYGIEVVGAEMFDGVEHFVLRRCQPTAGAPSCGSGVAVRYDEAGRNVVRRSDQGGTVSYSLYSEVCDLGLSFNTASEIECAVHGGTQFWFVTGQHGYEFDLGEGPSRTETYKLFDGFGGAVRYVSNVGPTVYAFEGNEDFVVLVYARLSGVNYGTPVFAFPTADDPGGNAPDPFALRAVYPNPARATATAAYTLDRPQDVALELLDVLGRVVLAEEIGPQAAGPHEAHLDLGGLRAGLYVLRLRGDESETTRRFVVIR